MGKLFFMKLNIHNLYYKQTLCWRSFESSISALYETGDLPKVCPTSHQMRAVTLHMIRWLDRRVEWWMDRWIKWRVPVCEVKVAGYVHRLWWHFRLQSWDASFPKFKQATNSSVKGNANVDGQTNKEPGKFLARCHTACVGFLIESYTDTGFLRPTLKEWRPWYVLTWPPWSRCQGKGTCLSLLGILLNNEAPWNFVSCV